MKAIYLTKFGKAHEAFEIREVADPILGEGEVRVKVEVSGLNFADVLGLTRTVRHLGGRP